jgi:hypothetical protein
VRGDGREDVRLRRAGHEVQRVRQERAVEHRQGERFGEVGQDGRHGRAAASGIGQPAERRDGMAVPVHGVDVPARPQERRQRARESAGPGAQVSPRPAGRADGRADQGRRVLRVHAPEYGRAHASRTTGATPLRRASAPARARE